MEETIAERLFVYDRDIVTDRKEFVAQLGVAKICNPKVNDFGLLEFDIVFLDNSVVTFSEDSYYNYFHFERINSD